MNAKFYFQTIFSLTLLLALSHLQAQQWAPQFANLSSAIYRTGNVGLGTMTPAANLHIATQGGSLLNPDQKPTLVEGGILTKEVRVRELWADYVFAPEYHLLSLPQVEAFIAENGHLPNTPSARDVAAQGINLGAATANQQEKIEELYLHLIEMNKRLEKLEAENAALKAQQQH